MLSTSLSSVTQTFLSQCKGGPHYVCYCCHRLMYRKTVLQFSSSKYIKAPANVMQAISVADCGYHQTDSKKWICCTCDRSLKRGYLPIQSIGNNLRLSRILDELAELNTLEKRLICQRIPFMKMVSLPSGRQRCIHGPAVNVPSSIDPVCSLLPRLPLQTQALLS